MCLMTGGFCGNHYENSSANMISHIYFDGGEVKNGYKAIIATGYKTVQLNASCSRIMSSTEKTKKLTLIIRSWIPIRTDWLIIRK